MTKDIERQARELSDDEALSELGLLYNFAPNDGPQFTRWQMIVAMKHGLRLARSSSEASGFARGIEAAAKVAETKFAHSQTDAHRAGLAIATAIRSLTPPPTDEMERMREALTSIAEGNLGDAPWQADYVRIREVARAALLPQDRRG